MLNSYAERAPYLAGGEHITGADAALAYPIVALKTVGNFDTMAEWEKGSFEETYPKLWEYMGRIKEHPAWVRSVEKIKEIEGKFNILP
jgi:glutathione S-transferase